MSQQGPILVVSAQARPSFAAALSEAKLFPAVETDWREAARAIETVQPAAVIAGMAGADPQAVDMLAKLITARAPYLPLIAVDPVTELPDNALCLLSCQRRIALHQCSLRRCQFGPWHVIQKAMGKRTIFVDIN